MNVCQVLPAEQKILTFSVVHEMLQKCFPLFDLPCAILGLEPEAPLFVLLRERIRNDRVNELIADLHVFLYLILPELSEAPRGPIVGTIGCGDLRFSESANEPARWVIQELGILGQWRRGWVDDACRERADIFAKEKLGRRIERKARSHVLEVDGVSFTQADLHLMNCVLGMFLKDVKVTNAIFSEEWAGHRAMKSEKKSLLARWKTNSMYFAHTSRCPLYKRSVH